MIVWTKHFKGLCLGKRPRSIDLYCALSALDPTDTIERVGCCIHKISFTRCEIDKLLNEQYIYPSKRSVHRYNSLLLGYLRQDNIYHVTEGGQ